MTSTKKTTAPPRAGFQAGSLESSKFDHLRGDYYAGLAKIKELDYSFEDIIHHFPAFVGTMTLARFISMFECYRKTLPISGHIAEIGVYKGAGTLFFSKLIQLYEPFALTQVHGFDWFEGMNPGETEKNVDKGSYKESYSRLMQLIEAQSLEHIAKIQKIDLTKDLAGFFENNAHLRFKLVFMDAGEYKIMKAALPLFWERLSVGGIILFDQYNFDIAPGETKAVSELLPGALIRTFPNGWMPNAYIVKGEKVAGYSGDEAP